MLSAFARKEITEQVQDSIHKQGNKPTLFFFIVYEAVKILTVLIDKVREQFKKIAELIIKKEPEPPADNPEKSSPVPKEEVATPQETAMPDNKDVIPPRPEFRMDIEEYDKLLDIYKRLAEQETVILTSEKEVQHLQQELELATSIFQGRHRKELQERITGKKEEITERKQSLARIVRANGYSSVDEFMKLYRKAKADYADYTKQLKAWGKEYGMKFINRQFEEQRNVYHDKSGQNR